MTIWKYPFEIRDFFLLEMPDDAKILSVQLQNGRPCIWALVDSKKQRGARRFFIAGTGNPIERKGSYIGTFQMAGGSLVWHLFEER